MLFTYAVSTHKAPRACSLANPESVYSRQDSVVGLRNAETSTACAGRANRPPEQTEILEQG